MEITNETLELAKSKGFKPRMKPNNISYGVDTFEDLEEEEVSQRELLDWLMKYHELWMDVRFDDNMWCIGVGKFTIPDWCPDAEFYLEECDSFKDSLMAYPRAFEKGLVESIKLIK